MCSSVTGASIRDTIYSTMYFLLILLFILVPVIEYMYFMIMFGGGSHHTRSGAILSLLNVLHGGVAGRCGVGVGVLLWYSLCDTVFSNSVSRGRCA